MERAQHVMKRAKRVMKRAKRTKRRGEFLRCLELNLLARTSPASRHLIAMRESISSFPLSYCFFLFQLISLESSRIEESEELFRTTTLALRPKGQGGGGQRRSGLGEAVPRAGSEQKNQFSPPIFQNWAHS